MWCRNYVLQSNASCSPSWSVTNCRQQNMHASLEGVIFASNEPDVRRVHCQLYFELDAITFVWIKTSRSHLYYPILKSCNRSNLAHRTMYPQVLTPADTTGPWIFDEIKKILRVGTLSSFDIVLGAVVNYTNAGPQLPDFVKEKVMHSCLEILLKEYFWVGCLEICFTYGTLTWTKFNVGKI